MLALFGSCLVVATLLSTTPAGASESTPVCSSGTCTVDFSFPGGGAAEQTWSVPADVTAATFTLWGASGGNLGGSPKGSPGAGAEVQATLSTSSTSAYGLYLGGVGGNVAGTGGLNGSGDGSGGHGESDSAGGGASSELSTETASDTRTLVAGGGGGGGSASSNLYGSPLIPSGGNGGAGDAAGTAGQGAVVETATLGGGGGGGSGDSGGTAGLGGTVTGSESTDPGCGLGTITLSGSTGAAGSPTTGGGGAPDAGGGGGGGEVGGGQGGGGADDVCGDSGGSGGGGGGSSFPSADRVLSPTTDPSGNGDGYATVSYADPVTTGAPSYDTTAGQGLAVPAASGLLSGATGAGLSAVLATNASSGSANVSTDGSFTYTPNAGFTGDDSFTYTVTDGSGDYATGTAEIAVAKIAQTITFTSSPPASPAIGGSYTPAASGGGSGNAVTFSVDASSTSDCAVSAGVVNFGGSVGTCVIDANQSGNSDHSAAAPVQQSFSIGQAAQVISFTSSAPTAPTVGGTYTVSGTGGASGNPVTFSIDPSSSPGACGISGASVSFQAAGSCVIDANQAGNTDYSAAPQVAEHLSIQAVTPVSIVATPVSTVAVAPGELALSSSDGAVTGSGVTLKVTCSGATSCSGTVELSVARKHKHGKTTVITHPVVADATVSLSAGGNENIVLHLTRFGRGVVARRVHNKHFRVTLLAQLSSRRGVERVYLPR